MSSRIGFAIVICLCGVSSVAAQVVRFETSLGDFDMVLNPTNNALLRDYANNMVLYVENNSYKSSWINRADENFVLQMGGFYSHTKRPPLTIASTRPVATFTPVAGQPAAETGLSNTVGTVSLALPGDGMGGTNQDAGTSSFFVNLASNSFLDANFTVFAAIPDMTVVNQIMALMQVDRTTDPLFGAGPGDLGFTDVPLQSNGFQVFINRAFVVTDAMTIAQATAGVQSLVAQSLGSADGSNLSAPPSITVPEPTSGLMLVGLLSISLSAVRRRV